MGYFVSLVNSEADPKGTGNLCAFGPHFTKLLCHRVDTHFLSNENRDFIVIRDSDQEVK
jgi:hypothetical protein